MSQNQSTSSAPPEASDLPLLPVAPPVPVTPVGPAEPVDPRALRQACGLFVTGVAVITTAVGGHTTGTTVNSFTSVSLDPPLVLICLHRNSRLLGLLRESGAFVVNLLGDRHELVARAFAGRATANVDDLPHHADAAGQPVLSGALAHLSCRLAEEFAGGDHAIVIGAVTELGVPDQAREPLIFFRGSFGALEGLGPAFHPIWDG